MIFLATGRWVADEARPTGGKRLSLSTTRTGDVIGLAAAAGDLWGHVNHGATSEHITLSAVVTFIVVAFLATHLLDWLAS